jgi:hypothetical protein
LHEHIAYAIHTSQGKGEYQMKPSNAIKHIREITNLLYDGYGDDIHPAEQLDMIRGILERVEERDTIKACIRAKKFSC